MTTDPLELDKRTREALDRLRTGGPKQSLAVARDLVDLGLSPSIAWQLVEAVLREATA